MWLYGQSSLSVTNSRNLLKLMSIESVMPFNHLILCHPLLLPSVFSWHQGLLQWVSSSHQVAKVLELQHQSFQWIFRLISFRIDWFDFLAVQGDLQHHLLKASILQHSAFFMVQISHLYMTTGKTIALTRQTFVGKMLSLLFNTLPSILKHSFSSKEQGWKKIISWLQSPSAVILKPKKINSITVSIFPHLFAKKWQDWN